MILASIFEMLHHGSEFDESFDIADSVSRGMLKYSLADMHGIFVACM